MGVLGMLVWLLYNVSVLGTFVFLFNSTGSFWSLLILLLMASFEFDPKKRKGGK